MKFIESEKVELKTKITDEIKKEIIAFANSGGGTIYIGVEDDGSIAGIENTDAAILSIANMIRDNIKPDLSIYVEYCIEEIGDKNVLAVIVKDAFNKPYYLTSKGMRPEGVFVRQGTSSAHSSNEMIRKMIKETDGDAFDTTRSIEQTLSFSDAEHAFQNLDVVFSTEKRVTLGIVNRDGIYTNTGLLLSDQCPYGIKLAVFQGTEKGIFKNRMETQGSILKQLEDAYNFIEICNMKHAVTDGIVRKEFRDYPEEAIREGLINSVMHRDYSKNADTIISIFDDRIEFVSIGGLCDGLTMNDIVTGISVCRNPSLAKILYRLKLVEAYGMGIQKITDSYSACSCKPKITVTENVFVLTLPNMNYCDNRENGYVIQTLNLNVQESELKNPSSIILANSFLNRTSITLSKDSINEYSMILDKTIERKKSKIIALASEKDYITRKEIEIILGTSQATSNRIIRDLEHEGELIRQGKGRNTRYVRR